jgi:hypothetical protein
MRSERTKAVLLLAVLALGGCSGGPSFGGPKRAQAPIMVDPNLYPANYRAQIAAMLQTLLTNRADFNALIAPPALKPVADSTNLHYVVCLQFNGAEGPKTKAVIYLGGTPTQYVDATPAQCDGAPYQPFPELLVAAPHR